MVVVWLNFNANTSTDHPLKGGLSGGGWLLAFV